MIPSIKLSEYLFEIATGKNSVGTEWRGRERESKRVTDQQSERLSIGQKWKWHGLKMAVSEKGHLSIFSNKSI